MSNTSVGPLIRMILLIRSTVLQDLVLSGRLSSRCPRWLRSEHDTGFHLQPLSVSFIRPEFPLLQGLINRFFLFRECTENVDVFYPTCFVDDDPHRNRIEP